MPTYQAVTTFSRDGYQCYGKRFVSSFADNWPIELVVYHESQSSIDEIFSTVSWRNLDHDPERAFFIKQHGSDPQKVGTERDPNSQAIRFCHKIFAITDAARRCATDWLIWIDADVVTTRQVELHDLEMVLPEGCSLSFLARPRYKYTECGFIGYRLADPQVRQMLEDMRHYYNGGEIFTRPKSDWHDSRCFDICRERSGIPRSRFHPLAPLDLRTTHVWQHSQLASFSEHHKGPARKHHAYGSIVP